MQSLAELSESVTCGNAGVEEQLWEWFSGKVYCGVVSEAADELVVRVRQRFSLGAVVAACQGYRKYAGGRGHAAQYGLAGLCWALLLRRLYGWDLRTLEKQIRDNLLVRWATGFALHEATPDHTVLWRFEDWMRQQHLDLMFVTVLHQIDEDFPEEQSAAFIGDTFGTQANIQDVSLNTLLRQTCQHLLSALQKALPAAYTTCVTQLDPVGLFGANAEVPEQRITAEERTRRTLCTAQAAMDLLAVVEPYVPVPHVADARQEAAYEALRRWGAILTKMLADEFTTKPLPVKQPRADRGPKQGQQKSATAPTVGDPSGPESAILDAPEPVMQASATSGLDSSATFSSVAASSAAASSAAASSAAASSAPEKSIDSAPAAQTPPSPAATAQTHPLRRCLQKERGSFRIISANDTDATVRNHGKSIMLGYNAAVLASQRFVRYLLTFTGSTADGACVAPLIASHRDRCGFSPAKYIFDRAAGTPKSIADVARASHGTTQLVARQIAYSQRSACFPPAAFTLTAAGLICPNGVLTTHAYPTRFDDAFNYRFLTTQCQDCPLWSQCRHPKCDPYRPRTVRIAPYAVIYQKQLAYLDSPQAKVDFAFRSPIERIIAALTRFNGARRARVRGLLKVSFQNLMAATAFNLKTWFTLTLQREKQGRKEKPSCPDRLFPLPLTRSPPYPCGPPIRLPCCGAPAISPNFHLSPLSRLRHAF